MQVKDKVLNTEEDKPKLVLTITASASEVNAAMADFFKDIASRDIPGFRKGKAPRSVLEQHVGGHANAMGGVAETLINTMAFKAIDDADVIFLEEPDFNVEETVEEDQPFTFTVSGPVAPEMTLSSIEPVAITMPPEQATDEEVEDQIAELQEFYHSFEDIKGSHYQAQDGDYVDCMATIGTNGKPLAGLNNARRLFGIGDGNMPGSFDEQLIGCKVGDVLEFTFDSRDENGESPFSDDGMLNAVIEVKGFRRKVLPPVDDELASKVGCVDVEDMRKQMRTAINQQKGEQLPKLMVDRAVAVLLDRVTEEVPEYFVEYLREHVGREFVRKLEEQGTNLTQWMMQNNGQADQMKEEVQAEAERRAKIDVAMEAMFHAQGWELTDEDIDAFFEGENTVNEPREDWEKANRMADIRKMCRQQKVTQWLVDTAEVTVEE